MQKKYVKISNAYLKYKDELFGNLEIKNISIGDSVWIKSLLVKEEKNKDIFVKFLHKQLINPKKSISEIEKINDIKLEEIGKKIVKRFLAEYYEDTGNFYLDFRRSLEKYDKFVDKSMEAMREMASLKITAFNDIFIKQSVYATSFMDSMQALSYNLHNDYPKLAAFSFSIDSWLPEIEKIISYTNSHIDIFNVWNIYVSEIEKKEKKIFPILKSYNWLISPTLPSDFAVLLVKSKPKGNWTIKKVNNFYISFFSENNWSILGSFYNNWKNKKLLKSRCDVIKNIFLTVQKQPKDVNIYYSVIPAIIAQINGFIMDYLEDNGIKWDLKQKHWDNCKSGKKNKKSTNWKEFIGKDIDLSVLSDKYDEIFQNILLNVLFEKAFRGEMLSNKYFLNRHKIMHGEFTDYAGEEHFIRLVLLFDFLVNLK